MSTSESSRPFKKLSAEESARVLAEVAWMASNGALRFKSDEEARAAAKRAQGGEPVQSDDEDDLDLLDDRRPAVGTATHPGLGGWPSRLN